MSSNISAQHAFENKIYLFQDGGLYMDYTPSYLKRDDSIGYQRPIIFDGPDGEFLSTVLIKTSPLPNPS